MGIITTSTGKKILKKAESLIMIPFVYDSTLVDYVLGQDLYDLSSIIGDSIALEQSDGESQAKYNEFSNEPVVKNVTAGEWKITAQCLDLQNAVLKSLFSAYYNNTAGIAAMRGEYETLYALIRVRFVDEDTPDVYFPKVQLNSKLAIQQIKTRGSQGNLGGTVLSHRCAVIATAPAGANPGTLYAFTDPVTNTPTYDVSTPVLFVPRTKTPLFFNHKENLSGYDGYVYDEILPESQISTDCCAHGRAQVVGEGTYTILT